MTFSIKPDKKDVNYINNLEQNNNNNNNNSVPDFILLHLDRLKIFEYFRTYNNLSKVLIRCNEVYKKKYIEV